MLGEKMVGEDGTGRGSIMAGEDEELDLSHREVFKIRVDAGSRWILLKVGFQGKINHRFVSIIRDFLNGALTLVEFAGKIAIHRACVVHVNEWAKYVDVLQWIDVHACCAPLKLFA